MNENKVYIKKNKHISKTVTKVIFALSNFKWTLIAQF